MNKKEIKKLLHNDWATEEGHCSYEEFVKAMKKASKLGLIDLEDGEEVLHKKS